MINNHPWDSWELVEKNFTNHHKRDHWEQIKFFLICLINIFLPEGLFFNKIFILTQKTFFFMFEIIV